LVNPAAADHAEFARMVPEKTQAFSDAGSILISRSEQIRQEMGRFIADEMTLAAQAAAAVLTARNPFSMIAVHVDAGVSWAARLATLPQAMCLLALKAHAAAMGQQSPQLTAYPKRCCGRFTIAPLKPAVQMPFSMTLTAFGSWRRSTTTLPDTLAFQAARLRHGLR
jgi:hypothetical protein